MTYRLQHASSIGTADGWFAERDIHHVTIVPRVGDQVDTDGVCYTVIAVFHALHKESHVGARPDYFAGRITVRVR